MIKLFDGKKIVCCLLAVLLVVCMLPENTYAYALDDSDVNRIQTGVEYNVKDLTTVDMYGFYALRISVPQAGRIKVWINDYTVDIYKEFYNISDGQMINIAESEVKWEKGIDSMNSGWISVDKGDFDFCFNKSWYSSVPEDEVLYVEFQALTTYDGEKENNDSFHTATPVSSGTTYEGNYSKKTDPSYKEENIDEDYYVFEIADYSLVKLNFSNLTKPVYSLDFNLYMETDSNYKEILGYEAERNGQNAYNVRLPEGKYYIKINSNSFESKEYSVALEIIDESKGNFEREFNNYSRNAVQIESNVKYTGNLYKDDDADWYKVEIPVKGYIVLECWTPVDIAEGKVQFSLYDDSIKKLTSKKATADKKIKTTKKLLSKGTYYICVKNIGELESIYDYNIRVQFRCKEHVFDVEVIDEPDYGKKGLQVSTCEVCQYQKEEKIPALTLKKVTQNDVKKYSSSKVKISWKDVKDEDGYQIYRMTKKDGSYSVSKKYTTSKSYINLKVQKGTTYYYKVRAYKDTDNGRVYGAWSKVKSYKL